jgi:mercuric ion transport protein
MDKYTKWLRIGIGGSIIAALCCFTPILVVLLGVLGLSAWVGWLDYVLFPTLAIFIVITIYYMLGSNAARRWLAAHPITKTRERSHD